MFLPAFSSFSFSCSFSDTQSLLCVELLGHRGRADWSNLDLQHGSRATLRVRFRRKHTLENTIPCNALTETVTITILRTLSNGDGRFTRTIHECLDQSLATGKYSRVI